ncbi:MAG: hypothetical protein OXC07_00050 [Kistimonas sp.]|nr:hypothetical protein [Kistimonas sp.]
MEKPGRQLVRAAVTTWTVCIVMGVLSMPVPAFKTGELEATTPEEAAYAVLDELTQSAVCNLSSLDTELDHLRKENYFKAECVGGKFFLKLANEPIAKRFLPVMQRVKDWPLLSDSILLPIAEFSFWRVLYHPDFPIKVFYGVYPWIEGPTLGSLLYNMRPSRVEDVERLKDIYRQLGTLLGTLHSAGLLEPGLPVQQLYSRLAHNDLHRHNLIVTPEKGLVILDIDSFSPPEQPRSVANTFVANAVRLLFLHAHDAGFFKGSPFGAVWVAVQPYAALELFTSYCQTLMGEDKAMPCVFALIEHMTGKRELCDDWRSSPWAEQTELMLPVDKEEALRRLKNAFALRR